MPYPVRHISATQATDSLVGDVSIRSLTELTQGQEMVQGLHRHDFYYFLLITRGTGSHHIDFQPYPVTAGSLYAMRPGQVHEHRLAAGAEGYLLAFADGYLSAYPAVMSTLQAITRPDHYALPPELTTELAIVLDRARSELAERRLGFADVVRAELTIFLTQLLRLVPEQSAVPGDQALLDGFLRLLDEDYGPQGSVSRYASALGITPHRLNQLTRDRLGAPVSELRHRRLLLEAKRRLCTTSVPVKVIAYDLGYEDVSYFSRFFRQRVGLSPNNFRRAGQSPIVSN